MSSFDYQQVTSIKCPIRIVFCPISIVPLPNFTRIFAATQQRVAKPGDKPRNRTTYLINI